MMDFIATINVVVMVLLFGFIAFMQNKLMNKIKYVERVIELNHMILFELETDMIELKKKPAPRKTTATAKEAK
jgi:hypothetical protein